MWQVSYDDIYLHMLSRERSNEIKTKATTMGRSMEVSQMVLFFFKVAKLLPQHNLPSAQKLAILIPFDFFSFRYILSQPSVYSDFQKPLQPKFCGLPLLITRRKEWRIAKAWLQKVPLSDREPPRFALRAHRQSSRGLRILHIHAGFSRNKVAQTL